nr:hypothetical protein [Pirellulales bacterium]
TRSHGLYELSPAIDSGGDEFALDLAFDQRGRDRFEDWRPGVVTDNIIDIGAVELARHEFYFRV